jgi:hypothetical protein
VVQTVGELEAVFGWFGGPIAMLYARNANRSRLAAGAIGKLDRAETDDRYLFPHLRLRWGRKY